MKKILNILVLAIGRTCFNPSINLVKLEEVNQISFEKKNLEEFLKEEKEEIIEPIKFVLEKYHLRENIDGKILIIDNESRNVIPMKYRSIYHGKNRYRNPVSKKSLYFQRKK